jgi:hypothetical protein
MTSIPIPAWCGFRRRPNNFLHEYHVGAKRKSYVVLTLSRAAPPTFFDRLRRCPPASGAQPG